MKSYDNDYYLHRNYLKEYSQSGSIFLDYQNNNLYDKNILIYGHNMSDGLMFHQLSKIYNRELGNSVKIKIYTKERNFVYNVFSVYMISPDDFNNNVTFNSGLQKSLYTFNYGNIDQNSILTLYTCNSIGDKRIIVHAALSNNE